MGMVRKDDPKLKTEVGARLALTRSALGHGVTDMSRLMESDNHGSNYSNYESGIRLISISHAMALYRNCGLTLDWIYFGDMRMLSADLQEKLRQIKARSQ
jgi:hypothetical protein